MPLEMTVSGRGGVGEAGLVVAHEDVAKIEDLVGADGLGIVGGDVVGIHLAVAGVFERARSGEGFEVLAGEAVDVVADAQALGIADVPVDFCRDRRRCSARWCRASDTGRAAGEVGGGNRDAGRDQLRQGVALAVVVDEEEELVLADGAAEGAAELVEVIGLARDVSRRPRSVLARLLVKVLAFMALSR